MLQAVRGRRLRDAVPAAVLANGPGGVREGRPCDALPPVAGVLHEPLVHGVPWRLWRASGEGPGPNLIEVHFDV